MWDARMLERRIWKNPFTSDYRDVDIAIAAYERIVERNPLIDGPTEDWRTSTRLDVQQLMLVCKIALTKLYFHRYQDNAGVTYFRSGLRRHDLIFKDNPNIGLSLVRSLYDPPPQGDSLEIRCGNMLKEVIEDHVLWVGDIEFGDTLLSVPLDLARTQLDRTYARGDVDYTELAENFYSRIIRMWPDSLVAHQARLSRADLYVMLNRYDDALADVEVAVGSTFVDDDADEVMLFKGVILAFGLERYDEAVRIFEDVMSNASRPAVAHGAVLNLAGVKMIQGNEADGIELLRRLELERDVPRETATTAMFLRALFYKHEGDWAGALQLFWRICRLEPFTRAGVVSPLILLRYQQANGDSIAVEKSLRKVADFYLDAIGKDSAYLKNRHLLKDFLIEAYLLCGKPREAAVLLGERSEGWRPANASVALLKSALIYLNLLNDRENGVRMLEKCLDLFPETRYARGARQELNRIAPNNR